MFGMTGGCCHLQIEPTTGVGCLLKVGDSYCYFQERLGNCTIVGTSKLEIGYTCDPGLLIGYMSAPGNTSTTPSVCPAEVSEFANSYDFSGTLESAILEAYGSDATLEGPLQVTLTGLSLEEFDKVGFEVDIAILTVEYYTTLRTDWGLMDPVTNALVMHTESSDPSSIAVTYWQTMAWRSTLNLSSQFFGLPIKENAAGLAIFFPQITSVTFDGTVVFGGEVVAEAANTTTTGVAEVTGSNTTTTEVATPGNTTTVVAEVMTGNGTAVADSVKGNVLASWGRRRLQDRSY